MDHAGIDLARYTNVTRWLAKCKASMKDYEEANGKGARMFGDFVKSKFN